MKFHFVATMEDGAVIEATSDARDLRRWEADHEKSMVGVERTLTYMTQVAYIAMRRTGALNGRYHTYELFDDHCVDLDMTRVGGDEGPLGNPTPSEVTDGSSPSLPSD